MFTPLHILCNSNRITLWQMVICGIPSFQFEDFLFPLSLSYKEKKVPVFSSPGRFDYRSPSGFGADLCEGPDKAEQGLVMQAWGSTGEIIIRGGTHCSSQRANLTCPERNIQTALHTHTKCNLSITSPCWICQCCTNYSYFWHLILFLMYAVVLKLVKGWVLHFSVHLFWEDQKPNITFQPPYTAFGFQPQVHCYLLETENFPGISVCL